MHPFIIDGKLEATFVSLAEESVCVRQRVRGPCENECSKARAVAEKRAPDEQAKVGGWRASCGMEAERCAVITGEPRSRKGWWF